MDVMIIDKTLDAVLENGLDNANFDFELLQKYITNDEKGSSATDDIFSVLSQPVDKDKEAATIDDIVRNVAMDTNKMTNHVSQSAIQQQYINNIVTQQHVNNSAPVNCSQKGYVYQNGVINNKGLPESPPDSGSEHAYSPPDVICSLHPLPVSNIQHTPPTPTMYHPPPQRFHGVSSPTKGFTNYLTEPPKIPSIHQQPHIPIQLPHQVCNPLNTYPAMHLNHSSKKRKHSVSPNSTINGNMLNNLMVKQENPAFLPDCTVDDYSYDVDNQSTDGSNQNIKWLAFEPATWATIYDATYKPLVSNYRVDSDKGFNMSQSDDAFVCQKKNHFQVTVHVSVSGEPKYVKVSEGYKPVDGFFLHFNGIKMEAQTQMIKIEQSQSDRSKRPFHPVELNLMSDQVTKVTIGRLHFSETTSNNMRKKGRPNPDQRYFMLVVSIRAHCGNHSYTVASHVSEKIIVRASNPGQFESDVELSWQKGTAPDSIFHIGRIGINTDHPDEALTVHGNAKVTGHIIQPSDQRVKENINEIDSSDQLKNVSQMKIYNYKYKNNFSDTVGIDANHRNDTGVLAQEVRQVLPDAVLETGDVVLNDGHRLNNLLMVNKDRIFMENVGAVKELCKLTDKMENRIEELEKMNKKLTRLKKYDSLKSNKSIVSTTSIETQITQASNISKPPTKSRTSKHNSSNNKVTFSHPREVWCSNRFIQTVIIMLIVIMAFCLVSITVLYLMEKQKTSSKEENLSLGKSANQPTTTKHTGVMVDRDTTRAPRITNSSSMQGRIHTQKHNTSSKHGSNLQPTRTPPVYISEWPPCVDIICEPQCCGATQSDGPSQGPFDHGSARVFPTNNNHIVNESVVIHTLPTGEIPIPTIHLLPDNEPSVNPSYEISNIDNDGDRRRKRSALMVSVSIKLKEMNYSITEHGVCRSVENCNQGNITYDFTLSNKFSVATNLTMQFAIDEGYIVDRCPSKQTQDCRSKTETDKATIFADEPAFAANNSGQVNFVLPIGRYYLAKYKFRIASQLHPRPCTRSNGDLGTIYREYNIHFHRQTCTDTPPPR